MVSGFVEPMLCRPLSLDKFLAGGWSNYDAELKIDGWRAIIVKNGSEVGVFSRTGKNRAGHVQHIVDTFQRYAPDGVYDGELVFANTENSFAIEGQVIPQMSFNKTARIMGSSEAVSLRKQETESRNGRIHFVLFDVIELDGKDYKEYSYGVRSVLANNLARDWPWVVVSPVWDTEEIGPLKLWDAVVVHKLEGLVLKNSNGLYVPGGRPNSTQFKVKAEKFFDVVVSGYTWGQGKYENMIGALKFGVYDNGWDFIEIGQTSGMTDAEREWWTQLLTTPEATYKDLQVIEIKANDLTDKNETGYGTPRHPQYIRLRFDKLPSECSLEQFKV